MYIIATQILPKRGKDFSINRSICHGLSLLRHKLICKHSVVSNLGTPFISEELEEIRSVLNKYIIKRPAHIDCFHLMHS